MATRGGVRRGSRRDRVVQARLLEGVRVAPLVQVAAPVQGMAGQEAAGRDRMAPAMAHTRLHLARRVARRLLSRAAPSRFPLSSL